MPLFGRSGLPTYSCWPICGSVSRMRPLYRAIAAAAVLVAIPFLAVQPSVAGPSPDDSTIHRFPPLMAPESMPPTASAITLDEAGIVAANLTSATSRYVSTPPTRIVDSRIGQGLSQRLTAGQTVNLTMTGGALAIPANATAVVLNVTMTDAGGGGFMTAWPAGEPLPTTSIVNTERVAQTIPNLVTVQIGAAGAVSFFTSVATHLIIDVQGYYAPVSASQAGRFQPVNPTRLLDTRSANAIKTGTLAAGEQVVINVGALSSLPADAAAAVLKVTVTGALGAGFWTAYPDGGAIPTVSNVNVGAAGDTISNQAIVPLASGKVRVFAERGGHLVVDIVGWYTGASAASSSEGLFTPVTPGRLLDTRQGDQRLGVRRTIEVSTAGRFGVPSSGVSAVALNTTLAPSTNPGFLTVWPARTYRPNASSLNASSASQTIAGHVVTPISAAGFALFSDNGGHVIADVAGWFAGTPTAAVTPPAVPLYGSGGPNGAPTSDQYMFQYGLSGGTTVFPASPSTTPFRWNPCSAIRYRINLGGYGEQFRALIEESFDRLSSASGLRFVYNGESTFMPTENVPFEVSRIDSINRSASYDIVVALGDEGVTDLVEGGVLGVTYIDWYRTSSNPGRIHRSTVTMDMEDLGSSVWGFAGFGPVMLHELGHALGLAHVNNVSQIMYPAVTNNFTFQDGDLRGLWREGQGGCL